MEAGRELDALVAEKIMKANKFEVTFVEAVDQDTKTVRMATRFEYPSYSIDIAAAWEVVEKLPRWHFNLERVANFHDEYRKINSGWTFMVTMKTVWPGVSGEDIIVKSVVSAPHAICLAALKAVGHEF